MVLSHKIEFKAKALLRLKRSLCNDKKSKLPPKYTNSRFLTTRDFKIYEAKIDITYKEKPTIRTRAFNALKSHGNPCPLADESHRKVFIPPQVADPT